MDTVTLTAYAKEKFLQQLAASDATTTVNGWLYNAYVRPITGPGSPNPSMNLVENYDLATFVGAGTVALTWAGGYPLNHGAYGKLLLNDSIVQEATADPAEPETVRGYILGTANDEDAVMGYVIFNAAVTITRSGDYIQMQPAVIWP